MHEEGGVGWGSGCMKQCVHTLIVTRTESILPEVPKFALDNM